jgi:hypothetical protein
MRMPHQKPQKTKERTLRQGECYCVLESSIVGRRRVWAQANGDGRLHAGTQRKRVFGQEVDCLRRREGMGEERKAVREGGRGICMATVVQRDGARGCCVTQVTFSPRERT